MFEVQVQDRLGWKRINKVRYWKTLFNKMVERYGVDKVRVLHKGRIIA